MIKFKFHQAQRTAGAVASAAVLAAGLLTMGPAMANNAFDAKMSSVIAHVKADPNYKSIPMNTSSDREWFYEESQALWQKKITKEQYLSEGARQFPGYEASLSELADLLTAS